MKRLVINPVNWSVPFGWSQAQLIESHDRVLVCSGQVAFDAAGDPRHPGDMGGQLGLALRNLEAVLSDAGMTPTDIVALRIYTTDVDEFIAHFPALTAWLEAASTEPALSLLGVVRLARPQLLLEIEALAVS
jgi:enamine deaminase RidA (YjgF/YER057c/UK114 family)